MRISTVGPLPPAPHDYMPHAKAFGNNIKTGYNIIMYNG